MALTLKRNSVEPVVSSASVAEMMMTELPKALGRGVAVTVKLVSLPVMTTFSGGMTA